MQRLRMDYNTKTKGLNLVCAKKTKQKGVAPSAYTVASRVINLGPCIVKTVHVAAAGANTNCKVYDGENANDKLKAHIEVLSGTSYTWRPGDGTDFDHGIYIEIDAATGVGYVTVTFIPESRKAFV